MSEQINQENVNEVPPPMAMLKMISGFWLSRVIYIAAKLGVADLVKDQPRTVAEIAEATGTHAPSLYRVLRALAGAGIFAEDENGRFISTPLATAIQTDAPGSLRNLVITELGEEHYPAWGDVMHSVKTGEIAFDHHFGMNVWDYFARHPENARTFNAAMSNMTLVVNSAILAAYDFSSFRRIVDVGGGNGTFLASILAANPGARGVIFDAPSVIEGAKQHIEAAGLSERCEAVGGDFFESVPEGGEAYLMKWIIHDWDDERAIRILKNCHRAMKPDGKLLLFEMVIPPSNEPSIGHFMDINMMVMTGGRERNENEFRALYEAGGFRLTRVISTDSPVSVIEGVRG